MSINFNLRKSTNSKGEKPLHLIWNHRGRRLEFATGLFLKPNEWNPKKQTLRSIGKDKDKKSNYIENEINRLRIIVNEFLVEGKELSYSEIKTKIQNIIHPRIKLEANIKDKNTFWGRFEEYKNHKKSKVTKGSMEVISAVEKHLREFEKRTKYELSFDAIKLEFSDKFTDYLLSTGIQNNTVSKHFSNLKAYMNWALDREYHAQIVYKKFATPENQVDTVHLTNNELTKIEKYEFKSDALSRIRDLFCFQCYTGQRFTDIQHFKFSDIYDGIWHLRSRKTKEILYIPISPKAQLIIDKYNHLDKLPTVSNQKTNDALKRIGEYAGIDTEIKKTEYRGSEDSEVIKKKYEFLTTHTARRTFVTLSLEFGLRPEVLMKITGHKDMKMLQKYIRVTTKTVQKEMQTYLRDWQ